MGSVEKRKGGAGRILFFAAALWLAVNLALAYPAYQDFREKMTIAAIAAAEGGKTEGKSEDADFDGAAKQTPVLMRMAQYLKDGDTSGLEQGMERLCALGYFTHDYGTLQMQLAARILWNMAVTGAVFVIAAFLFVRGRYKADRETEALIRAVCEQIEAVRKRDNKREQEEDAPESQETDGMLWRISEELSLLCEHMQMIQEGAHRDREETKSLVTDISHQLRTPLMALRASFDLLVSGKLKEEEYTEFLSCCRGQLGRLMELTDALLQISRLETGLIALHLQQSPLFDTILMAVNRIYPRAQEKNIEIIFEEPDENDADVMLWHDEKWLSEALINILENAVKYSDGGSQIRISLFRMAASVRIEIEDQGIGVSAQERNQIFRRFWRGQDARVQAQKGQGIGLYLSRQIVEKHHGTIRVAAVIPQGSRFIVSLPLS